MKKLFIALACLGIVIAYSFADSIQEVQSIDGAHRNRLEGIVGGGGGSGDVSASGNNTFSGANTFNGSLTASNIALRGWYRQNTNNASFTGDYTKITGPSPTATSDINLEQVVSYGVNNFSETFWGDPGSPGGVKFGTEGGNRSRIDVTGTGRDLYIRIGGNVMAVISSTSFTHGTDSGSAQVFNGSTWTIANTPQINTDVLKIPSAGGYITNGTKIVSSKGATSIPLHLTPGVPATSIDFDYKEQILNNTTNLTLSSSNLSPGDEVTLKIFNDSNARTLTVPAGWIAGNTSIPTGLTASKVTTLHLSCTGTTDSSVLVYTSQQP